MKAGFTGTREKPTDFQIRNFKKWVLDNKPLEMHQGGCINSDEVAATVGACHCRKCVCHPPINEAAMSQYAVQMSDEVREPNDYLARNKNIVNETDTLLAMPKGPEEQRSGTWSTIRYARSLSRPIVIFWPDGSITTEGANRL